SRDGSRYHGAEPLSAKGRRGRVPVFRPVRPTQDHAGHPANEGSGAMKIERKITAAATGAYGAMAFAVTTSEIRNPDGKVVFRNDAVEVPEGWSQVASDVLAQKYFRKAGVPAVLKRVKEKGVH